MPENDGRRKDACLNGIEPDAIQRWVRRKAAPTRAAGSYSLRPGPRRVSHSGRKGAMLHLCTCCAAGISRASEHYENTKTSSQTKSGKERKHVVCTF